MDKEKMIHIAIYFIKNTKHCHRTKLYCLLCYFDFGTRPVKKIKEFIKNSSEYSFGKYGPQHKVFKKMTEKHDRDLYQKIEIIQKTNQKGNLIQEDYQPKENFNEALFSKEDIERLKKYACLSKEFNSDRMNKTWNNIKSSHSSSLLENFLSQVV